MAMKEDIKDNQIMLLKEDLECVHLYLDDKKIPRQDNDGEVYSIVGRIREFENRILKQSSDLETELLKELTEAKLEMLQMRMEGKHQRNTSEF